MKWAWFVPALVFAGGLAPAAGTDPDVTTVVTLPGPAVITQSADRNVVAMARQPEPDVPRPGPLPVRIKPAYRIDFGRESALFCQKRIGQWKEVDARAMLGDPLGRRASIDDTAADSGHIFAFADPSGRYKELELHFDSETGLLRTVFAYPRELTWQGCRRIWGSQATATDATKGQVFYSYATRRMDVLVDPAGTVISLGLY